MIRGLPGKKSPEPVASALNIRCSTSRSYSIQPVHSMGLTLGIQRKNDLNTAIYLQQRMLRLAISRLTSSGFERIKEGNSQMVRVNLSEHLLHFANCSRHGIKLETISTGRIGADVIKQGNNTKKQRTGRSSRATSRVKCSTK